VFLSGYLRTIISFKIVLGFLAAASGQSSRTDDIQLALRRTADKLLRISGDESSRIEVKQDQSNGEWSIHLNAHFNYDSLPEILQSSLDQYQIKEPYTVQIKRCDDHQMELGYHQFDFLNTGSVPCAGRDLSDACRYILIKFVQSESGKGNHQAAMIVGLSLMFATALLSFFFYRRKRLRVNIPQSLSLEEPIRIGGCEFYPETQTLIHQHQTYKLTFREAKLFNLFASNPHQLLDRDFIMKEIWENEGVMVGRSLDVFVSRLRKKLAIDPSIQINAVHGVGYKMEIAR